MSKKPQDILRQYWGYPAFRELQEEIVTAVIAGRHTLALLPTGGGKSVCFQVPALSIEGICIVISPLIALMKDQVYQLKKRGIPAVAIYSGMSQREIDLTLDNCIYGDIKFLYVSPERIKTELFIERARRMNINLLAIDEAHCISQWGYDFRPPYLEIQNFIDELGIKNIIALTASATKEVKQDIIKRLGLKEPEVFQKSFARSNLSYSVFELENKVQKMLEILGNVKGTSVIYVRNRKRTREIAEQLVSNGISADYYHAGLSSQVRSQKQDAWINNQIRVIVATNAFGMGIDKPDVRTVIHMDLPDSLEAYYQEAGRAGRDEKKAYAIALFHHGDLGDLERRTEQMSVGVDLIRRTYQALANYYKLAVGSQPFSSFAFDYQHFVSNFNLPYIETYYALNKLQDEGLIQITDSFNPQSKIMFLQAREEVYKFQIAHSGSDRLIKNLMRLYGGEMFTNYVLISENDLAKMQKEAKPAIIKQLRYLHQMELLEYQESSDHPQLTFLTSRFDSANLPIDKQQIEWRRQVAFNKTRSVTKYMRSTTLCRSKMIQLYFDEQPKADCGVCDVCVRKKRLKLDVPDTAILHFLSAQSASIEEIKIHFKQYDPALVIETVRELLDINAIALGEEGKYGKV